MNTAQLNSSLTTNHEQMLEIIEMLNDTSKMAQECVDILKEIDGVI